MGLTYITTSVSSIGGVGKPYEEQFLVDTGAIDCMAPASRLKAAGIAVEGRDSYELANNDLVEYPYGFATVEFMGSRTVTRIIFGEEECELILGVVAIESTGIGVDPVTRTLRRMAAKPLKQTKSSAKLSSLACSIFHNDNYQTIYAATVELASRGVRVAEFRAAVGARLRVSLCLEIETRMERQPLSR